MENDKSKIKSFRDLEVWKLGMKIVTDVYEVTRVFPKEETYGLANQMRRAAVSIPSNIAEGFSGYHNKEYRQFIYFALGSCAELETQTEIAQRLGFISSGKCEGLIEDLDHESRMLRNLSKKLA